MNKLPDAKKVESLVSELIRELDIEINDVCHGICLWIHDKEKLIIESSCKESTSIENNFIGKYIGNEEVESMQTVVFTTCSICGEDINKGDSYYEVGAQDVCEKCIDSFKRTAGEE